MRTNTIEVCRKHAEDGGALVVGNGVKELEDLQRVRHVACDRMRRDERIDIY